MSRKTSPEVVDRAVALYEGGMSTGDVLAATGMSQPALYRYLRQREVEIRHAKRPGATAEERFWSRVDKSGGPDCCWVWLGARIPAGHGHFKHGRERHAAHRFALQLTGVELEPGNHVHHECEQPSCVNPAHLAQLTPAEHGAAHSKTHCKYGHELSDDVRDVNGNRYCRPCHSQRGGRYYARRRAELSVT